MDLYRSNGTVGMGSATEPWAVRSTENSCLREAWSPEIPKKRIPEKKECPKSEKQVTYGASEDEHGYKVGIQYFSQEERMRKLYTRRGKPRCRHSPW